MKRARNAESAGPAYELDMTGAPLRMQPLRVWKDYSRTLAADEVKRLNVFDLYEPSGLYQQLQSFDSTVTPPVAPTMWCNACRTTIALSLHGNGKTVQYSALSRHTRVKHPEYLLEADKGTPFEAAAAAAAATAVIDLEGGGSSSSSSKLPSGGNARLLPLADDDIFKNMRKVVGQAFLADGRPANAINHPGMRHLLMKMALMIKPSYALGVPSRYFVDKDMMETAENLLALLKAKFAPINKKYKRWLKSQYSLLVDKWDDGNGNDVLGVTVRFVDAGFKFHSDVIAALPSDETTAVELRGQLEEILGSMGLDILDAFPTTDAGQPMPAMFNEPDWLKERWIRCSSHLMENAVKATLAANAVFADTMKDAWMVSGQIMSSNKRKAKFEAAKAEYFADADIKAPPGLKTHTEVRWDSSYATLKALNDNMPVILKLKAADFPFKDAGKKTLFAEALSKMQDKGLLGKKRRLIMTDLGELLSTVHVASKESQQDGVTVHLFSSTSEKLCKDLESFASDAPEVEEIATRILTEYKARYQGVYPKQVSTAAYFCPETCFDLYERADFDWPTTDADGALSNIKEELLPLIETGPVIVPLPVRMMVEPVKSQRIKALQKQHDAASKKDIIDTITKEFNSMKLAMVTDVYERREAHKEVTAEYEEAFAAYELEMQIDPEEDDAKEPVEPKAVGPYMPIDTLEWWAANASMFEYMPHVARRLLCISFSAAEVERLFSRGGLVMGPRRNRLGTVKENLFILSSYNLTRTWKAARKLGEEDEAATLSRMFPVEGGLDFD